jgi:16S rRNA (adenine1518-N6/adenine1519-N6)-dimethyltransferase
MTAIDGLPPLSDVIRRFGLDAKKALGQNFILDLNLTQKIARTAGPLQDVTIIEVGPGPGGLTRAILSLGARKVIAIERDARCLPALAEISDHYPGRLQVLEADALKVDFSKLDVVGPVAIIANLPYNVGTQLLINWITTDTWPPFWQSLTLMFQKEVGQRIVATANESHFGRLAVICGWRTEARMAFDVPPQAFTPTPKVTSTVVHLVPRIQPIACEMKTLERVSEAAFGQRRKMLRQSLKALGGDLLLQRAGIDSSRRAETLSIDEFCAIARAYDG